VRRRRIAALALCAYPSETRQSSGEEILATLLDCSEASTGRFVRELIDLLRFGLRARAAQTAAVGWRRLIADGLCLAAMVFLAQDLATALRSRGVPHALYSPTSIALLVVLLATALIGRDRLAGAGALLLTALRLPGLLADHLGLGAYAGMILPAFCLLAMVLAPRARPLDGLGWLAALIERRWRVVVAVAIAPALIADPSLLVVGVVLLALAMLLTDPRMAIVLAVTITNLGIGVGHAPVLVSAPAIAFTPAILAFTIVRTQRLQRQDTASR
jgi:hypothetical protein